MPCRQTDSQLVAKALAGDAKAFDELVLRYRDAVFGVAFHRLGDFEEARDVAQQAFLKAYLNLPKLRKPDSFTNWLYHIAEGTALDATRRKQKEPSLIDPRRDYVSPVSEQERTQQADLARRVREALSTLTESTRLAVILHYINGYSHAEVAGFLGLTPGAVKTRLSRARNQLREEMAEMVGELGKCNRAFSFKAMHSSGKVIEGVSEAASEAQLRERLRIRGYDVVEVTAGEPMEEKPMERFAQVILQQAFKDKASLAKLFCNMPTDGQGVTCIYVIEGMEHDVLTAPGYIWRALREQFGVLAGVQLESEASPQQGTIRFGFQGEQYELPTVIGEDLIEIRMRKT